MSDSVFMSASQLVAWLRANPNWHIEAGLVLRGNGRSTHILIYKPKTNALYDTGCDSETRRITLEVFAEDTLSTLA
jgi:hypothetical protein